MGENNDAGTQIARVTPNEIRRQATRFAAEWLSRSLPIHEAERVGSAIALAMVGGAMQAAANNKKAQAIAWERISPQSISSAVIFLAQTGLNPDPARGEVYIFPRGGALQCVAAPKGLLRLYREAGYKVVMVAHKVGGDLEVEAGEVVGGSRGDPDWLPTWDTLRGFEVRVTGPDGHTARPWFNRAWIEQRRACSQDPSVWRLWPIEMARKTCIRALPSMGFVVVGASGERLAVAVAAAEDAVPEARPRRQAVRAPEITEREVVDAEEVEAEREAGDESEGGGS